MEKYNIPRILNLLSICMILSIYGLVFNGCAGKEPDIKVVVETEVVFVEPYITDYSYVAVPTLREDVDTLDTSRALDVVTEYAIKLQSVVEKYELRMDSLSEWVADVKKKQLEIKGAKDGKEQ